MDDSALPFIRATDFTWEEMDLKRQAPLELRGELTKSTLSVFINRSTYARDGLPGFDIFIYVMLLGKNGEVLSPEPAAGAEYGVL